MRIALCLIISFLNMVNVAEGSRRQLRSEMFCGVGFIMDTFCINRGTLLDRPSVQTLLGPGQHTVHCLVDVGVCIGSGYEVLGEPDVEGDPYTRVAKFDPAGNDMILEFGRKKGRCSTCTGEGDVAEGLKATVVGSVFSPGGESFPRLVNVTKVLDESVGCGGQDICFDRARNELVLNDGRVKSCRWLRRKSNKKQCRICSRKSTNAMSACCATCAGVTCPPESA